MKKGKIIGLIIGIVVLLVGLGIGAFFIIKLLSPNEEQIKRALPEEIISYKMDGEEFESEVKSVEIIDKRSMEKLECEIVLDDDYFTRTFTYIIEFEKEDGEWEVDDFKLRDARKIKIKDPYIEYLVSFDGYSNIERIKNVTDKKSHMFKYQFDVDQEFTYCDVEGTVTVEFNVGCYFYEDGCPEYHTNTTIDDSELEKEWDFEGAFVDAGGDPEIGAKFTCVDENLYDIEVCSYEYGISSDTAYSYSYGSDEKIEIYAETSIGVMATYVFTFTKDSVSVSAYDGYQYVSGDFDLVEGDCTELMASVEEYFDSIEGLGESDDSPSIHGDAIYVYSYNDDVERKIENYFKIRYPEYADLVICKNLNLTDVSKDYENEIDLAMETGGDMVPSIISADYEVLRNFMEKDYVVPISQTGITSDMYADAYEYTIDYATVDNELMALTWHVNPGVVAYRTDIAEEVLGDSDPEYVQQAISDWDSFFDVAEMMKAAGRYMVSGPDDIKYAVRGMRTSPWVVDGALNIDPAVNNYLEYSKKLKDNGYTKNTVMWSSEWIDNMTDDVFCYFGSSWFVPWTLYIEESEVMGKYNVIKGPNPYCWGGTYLMITDECPNPELAELVLYTLCCDSEVMYDINQIDTEFPNNQVAVSNLIADGKGSMDKLGGQNPIPVYDEVSRELNGNNVTSLYDFEFNLFLDDVATDYYNGSYSDIDAALDDLKQWIGLAHDDIIIE